MEAVPRMPMIWLDLKEAGEFAFNAAVKKFVLKNYGENPENYNEELRKLEVLRQSAVNVPRDFEGCSTLRKYFGQLHYLQSRIPMGAEQEAAVPIAWTEIFSGKTVTHEDIKYEQACILYNLGALHSMLGAMDKRVSEEGMKVSCTHFQCAAGAFTYLRDHFPHSYSVDMSHQILSLNINLMLGQAQECLLEKSMLDNRKSFLVARISAQVVDYYKEACRALENSETASLLGKIQKDWKKLVQMKIYYFAAVAHLHMGKQAEEQQKFGERVIYFQSALDKLNEAIKLAKGQPETVQEALRFTMDVIGGKYNSAKKDNDFIYHEAVPALDTLQSVKGAPLVKALPVNPTDPAVTGPDIFAKLVPMAAHEASSLYSEEKAKLLRDVMAKIEAKNEVLDQFMDSMQLDPETVDNLDMYSHIPPILMEKCAALSVRPDTVKNLVQSMQVLSGVFTDVEASLKEIRDLLEEDEAQERKLQELLGKGSVPQGSPPPPSSAGLAEVSKECSKYMEVHEKASFTNTELHKAMNLHIGNLRLLSGPLEQVRAALPSPTLSEDDKQVLQNLKKILGKVQEMRDQRMSLEQQLREMIQKDDITTSLVTTDRSEMKKLFEEQLKKYDQIKVYLEQNLAAQENILKALTDANVKYAAVRKALAEVEHKWNTTVQTLVASYEAYEDLMKKSQEGKDFYTDLEGKAAKLLEKARAACQAAEANRQQILEKEMKKHPPPRPTAPKPALQKKALELEAEGPEAGDLPPLCSLGLADLPEDLRSLPPDVLAGHLARLPPATLAALALDPALAAGLRPPGPELFAPRLASAPLQPGQPFAPPRFPALPGHYALPPAPAASPGPFPHVTGAPVLPAQLLQPSAPQVTGPPPSSAPSSAPQLFPAASLLRGPGQPGAPLVQPGYAGPHLLPPRSSPQHGPAPAPAASYGLGQPGLPPPGPVRPPAVGPPPGPVVLQGPLVPSPAPSPQPPVPVQPPPLVPGPVPQRPPPSLTPAPGPAESPFQRQSSSTDDLLSSSPESQHGGSKAAVGQPLLQPTKADAKDGQKPKAVQLIENDPYEKPERLLRLRAELERFRALLQRLERPEPGGAPELDALWKELQDAQERDARQLSIAIARCYSMKNRHQDIMPYDRNRVVLRSGKDDYINASRVEDLSPYCPTIIATQAPLLGTAADFWLMIYEQKVSVVVMLVSEQELDKQKVLRYFPTERGQPVVHGPVTLVLTSVKAAPTHVERMITLQYRDQSLKRTVIHLQFTSWPELGLPDSKASLLRFVQEVHGHYLHQRPLHTPIVVHCSSGVGRTGAFCLVYAAVQELEAGNGIPELAELVRRMRQQRKHMLQEKLHLKFCYEAVLQHAEQLLLRHGVGAPPVPKANSASPKLYFQQDPQDLVLGGDVPISSIQATIAKLSVKAPGCGAEGGAGWGAEVAPAPDAAAAAVEAVPVPPEAGTDAGTVADGDCAPIPEPEPQPLGEAESSNHVEEQPHAAPPAPAPAPAPASSLELLASLTPEAFTLDASLKGKQHMNKQNFLQAQTGEGLRAPRPSDDPLSMLDPLWTLNKS
ncbi:tyrosine-protein phosphatase non-receptor type 23 [Numida meleagris]|uniref:tyrosine-protein phosphatase non-receptor type 23 n=1 Tax=Numida meleagris TaxID=8996 RepID=UPI000B3E3FED|nr:tyrosine-protein phosphatase non-receptor type 23 [Numida meleagris]